jgi:hypothetical protein
MSVNVCSNVVKFYDQSSITFTVHPVCDHGMLLCNLVLQMSRMTESIAHINGRYVICQ